MQLVEGSGGALASAHVRLGLALLESARLGEVVAEWAESEEGADGDADALMPSLAARLTSTVGACADERGWDDLVEAAEALRVELAAVGRCREAARSQIEAEAEADERRREERRLVNAAKRAAAAAGSGAVVARRGERGVLEGRGELFGMGLVALSGFIFSIMGVLMQIARREGVPAVQAPRSPQPTPAHQPASPRPARDERPRTRVV